MEAALVVAIAFLPAIIYLVRTPYRLDRIDVLVSVIGVWLGLSIAAYLVRWLLSQRAAYWAFGVMWFAMSVYAWVRTSAQRRTYPKRYKVRGKTEI